MLRGSVKNRSPMPRIARVIVEVTRDREFDYLVPERIDHEIEIGSMVVVPFGRSEARGYVVGFKEQWQPHQSLTRQVLVLESAAWLLASFVISLAERPRSPSP
jgi:primosomal protein N'